MLLKRSQPGNFVNTISESSSAGSKTHVVMARCAGGLR